MNASDKRERPAVLRLRITVISLLSLVVTTACALLRQRPTPTPTITCYEVVITEPPTPAIFTCYTAPPPTITHTPTVTAFTSPLSTPTPTPTAPPEARRSLLGELLAEGRFPTDVMRKLES